MRSRFKLTSTRSTTGSARSRRALLGASLLLLGLGGCLAPARKMPVSSRPDVPISLPPFEVVHVEWKQRMEQPYVFLELLGSYEETGRFLNTLMHHVEAQGLRPSGPPFGLFFDDPLRVPLERCRSRIAVPVEGLVAVTTPLGFDLLPSSNVVYAHAAGPYPQVSKSYTGLFDYCRERGWVLDGPIREIYLRDPSRVQSFDQLVTEVQLPWRPL